jgi:hypothetical protein
MSILIYGASDDLIEVDGDLSDEFTYMSRTDGHNGDLLAFSDGTILRIQFTDTGVWRITPVVGGAGYLNIVQAPEGDEDNYSDRATLDGAVWVVHGISYAGVVGVR